ncbi:DUF5103 domain-containing protein [Hugenholtzia roseola]|uniref:type IX secretion system plug protein n=1 Tax=Hugenholtzia roseola TaxID=1002 RepID=UPI000478C79B|nr:DUF5103 domain-containing protein [Hugenholtzia roseola]
METVTKNPFKLLHFYIKFALFLLFLSPLFSLPLLAQENNAPIFDRIVNPDIKTVLFYPNLGTPEQILRPAITTLDKQNLVLEFDILNGDGSYLMAKIYNCWADWRISELPQMEYLDTYNDFPVQNFEYSINTKVSYVHYKFQIPPLKVSGNYVVKIFESGADEENDEPLLIRRFTLYEPKGSVFLQQVPLNNPTENRIRHQINASLNYGGLTQVVNPAEQLQIVIRQNYRWDNALYGLKPTFIQAFDKTLQYNHFNLENTFWAANEMRICDLRSMMRLGINVDSIQLLPDGNAVHLRREKSRENSDYAFYEDFNGRVIIEGERGTNPSIEADYARVNFYLNESESMYNKDVYLIGNFNDWQITEAYLFKYYPTLRLFHGEFWLKQGVYSYYLALSDVRRSYVDALTLENSHFQARHVYDAIGYFRPMGARTDYAIAYNAINQ